MSGQKIAQLVKTIVLGVATLIVSGVALTPYWFILNVKISWDAGRTIQDKFINLGIYFMDQGEINMIDMNSQVKASNAKVLPEFLRVAQIFYLVGSIGLLVSFLASLVYFFRKYRTTTGEMCLAAGLLPTSLCLVLGVVCAALSALVKTGGNAWESLPVPNSYISVNKDHTNDPVIAINLGLYIAAFGVLLALGGTAIAWMQACILCKHTEAARYQLLHAPLTDEERGLPSGNIYRFPNRGQGGGFRYDGGYGKPHAELDF